jgi:single-strand DNA-binding protein
MNKVILMGRMTRDPEVRYSKGERQMAIARYTLAVDRRRSRNSQDNGQQTADFISCVAFDRQAEFAEKYLHKGSKMVVTGRIQTGSYTNRDGQKVYTTDVVIEDQEFAESKSADTSRRGDYTPADSAPAGGGHQGGSSAGSGRPDPSSAAGDGFMNIPDNVDDEGLPFN